MSTELKHIETALNEPFPCTLIRFKPKQPRQNTQTKRWECLALPYADKRVYEDRLNELAFGDWSTPYTPPIVAGNKLVVPVTVIIYGVSHTDFGEAFLSSTTRKGDIREEENSATEAYSQAFRRACSQFGLGRYLYQLPKLWLPYDSASRSIAITEDARITWVKKLYTDAGLPLLPAHRAQQVHPTSSAPGKPQSNPANGTDQGTAPQTAARVDAQLLKYLRNALDAEQTRKTCRYYHVNDLADLTPQQALHLSDYIEQQDKQTAAPPAHA